MCFTEELVIDVNLRLRKIEASCYGMGPSHCAVPVRTIEYVHPVHAHLLFGQINRVASTTACLWLCQPGRRFPGLTPYNGEMSSSFGRVSRRTVIDGESVAREAARPPCHEEP